MSDVADRLRTRFGNINVRVVVPEWRDVLPLDSRDEPAIYARPFTLADSQKLQRWIDENSPEGWAQVLLRKALNEEGDRLFDIADRKTLMQCCEAHILSRVAQSIIASVDLDTAEGNSSATPS